MPTASGIAPGDVLIVDFFNDWLKFEPSTGQLFSLPWTDRPFSILGGKFTFDLDGTVIRPSNGSLIRIHPVTGNASPIGLPTIPGAADIAVTPEGDYVIARPATTASIENGEWLNGIDGGLYYYRRATGELTAFPKPDQFSPNNVAVGVNGEIYVSEFFRGLVRIDFASGIIHEILAARREFTDLDVLPDGQIATALFASSSSVQRVDPVTGNVTPLAAPFPAFRYVAPDEDGGLWLTESSGLYYLDKFGNGPTLAKSATFFSPWEIAFVPSGWTPPIPEPQSLSLAMAACLCSVRRRTCLKHLDETQSQPTREN